MRKVHTDVSQTAILSETSEARRLPKPLGITLGSVGSLEIRTPPAVQDYTKIAFLCVVPYLIVSGL